MSTNDKIGFGVVGLGIWGEYHLKVYSQRKEISLLAVCDINETRARQVGERFNVESYTNLNDMLKRDDIKAIGVATPDFAHKDVVVAIAKAGKHVCVEKPMAKTIEDCKEMLKAAEETGAFIMVDFHCRWAPPLIQLFKSLRNNELGVLSYGNIYLNNPLYIPMVMLNWSKDTSSLWFLGSHCIDTLRWLLQSEVKSVYSVARSEILKKEKNLDIPDFYKTIIEFDDGLIINMENSWILPDTEPTLSDFRLELYGNKGVAKANITQNRSLQLTLEKGIKYPDVFGSLDVYGKMRGMALESISHFVDSVISNSKPLVTGEDGLMNTTVLCAIEKSVKEGKKILLDEII